MKNKVLLSGAVLLSCWMHADHIAVVGCGYVGLTLTALLVQGGHHITCVDIIPEKIADLSRGVLPLHEPGVSSILFDPKHAPLLTFTTDIAQVKNVSLVYLCVPTPPAADGSCDYSMIHKALEQLTACPPDQQSAKIVCIKSTLSPGTMKQLAARFQSPTISLVYNPEFMREGSALSDMQRNPIVIGTNHAESAQQISHLYAELVDPYAPVCVTNYETAELIKYGWNAFSALRVTYVNELATLCRAYGADPVCVVKGIAESEKLLPTASIKPGPGYGGSCFPKDVLAFSMLMEGEGIDSSLVHQTIISNENHKKRLIADIRALCSKNSKKPKTVALLGLAFKAGTNDIRNAPAIDIIKALVEDDIAIRAYDPCAGDAMRQLFPQCVYCDSPYDAVMGVDCIVVLTEWPEIKNVDLARLAANCNTKIVIDTRNLYDNAQLQLRSFENGYTLGRKKK